MRDSILQEVRMRSDVVDRTRPSGLAANRKIEVALLTGGIDKPYVLGLSSTLASLGIFLDLIGSDELRSPELLNEPQVSFLNLRGDQRREARLLTKVLRILRYYAKLILYAATAKPAIFHILWNNRFQLFDRTVLMLYYKLLGKKVVFTVHNVNAGKRDLNDSFLNRCSLKVQYRLSDHLFVHTTKMKNELCREFGVPESKVTVIPFGINNTLPCTPLTGAQAKQALGISDSHKTLLFFGRIARYKGLEYLLAALAILVSKDESYRLIVAGTIKDRNGYWDDIQESIARAGIRDKIINRIEFIPDEKVEFYFKAADVLVLPYTDIFQSGVLFLGYSFGLPVVATDVGDMREDIVEGKTGFVCQPRDPLTLANAIESYFASELFRSLAEHRQDLRDYANERYSWARAGQATQLVYAMLLRSNNVQ